MRRYPLLEIDRKKLRKNGALFAGLCRKHGAQLFAVTKGFHGIPEVAETLLEAGCCGLADSRLSNIQSLRENGFSCEILCIRTPSYSEVRQLVRLADGCLVSETSVLSTLEQEAAFRKKKFNVLLMLDLGDLREGWFDEEEFVEAAVTVERKFRWLHLKGTGTNLGCYGSIKATPENLGRLIAVTEIIEARIGRRLEWISGGGTNLFPLLYEGRLPGRINHIRAGEGLTTGKDLIDFYSLHIPGAIRDCFVLKGELVEVRRKPTYPVGEFADDFFDNASSYVDRGIRLRGLVNLGRGDFTDLRYLTPRDPGIETVGCSSDYLIVDLEESPRDWKIGEIVSFDVDYRSLLSASGSPSVSRVFL